MISNPGEPGIHYNTLTIFESYNNIISSRLQQFSAALYSKEVDFSCLMPEQPFLIPADLVGWRLAQPKAFEKS